MADDALQQRAQAGHGRGRGRGERVAQEREAFGEAAAVVAVLHHRQGAAGEDDRRNGLGAELLPGGLSVVELDVERAQRLAVAVVDRAAHLRQQSMEEPGVGGVGLGVRRGIGQPIGGQSM